MLDTLVFTHCCLREVRDADTLVELDLGEFDIMLDKAEVARLADWLLAWLIQQSE